MRIRPFLNILKITTFGGKVTCTSVMGPIFHDLLDFHRTKVEGRSLSGPSDLFFFKGQCLPGVLSQTLTRQLIMNQFNQRGRKTFNSNSWFCMVLFRSIFTFWHLSRLGMCQNVYQWFLMGVNGYKGVQLVPRLYASLS